MPPRFRSFPDRSGANLSDAGNYVGGAGCRRRRGRYRSTDFGREAAGEAEAAGRGGKSPGCRLHDRRQFVAKATPDGHTLLLMEPGAVLAKWMNKSVPYDVTKDFTPIALVATQPLVLFAHPSLPANDVKELIAYAKANPRKLVGRDCRTSGPRITLRRRG